MQALVDMQVYQMVTVYDYQALCEEYLITMKRNRSLITPNTMETSTDNSICSMGTGCKMSKCCRYTPAEMEKDPNTLYFDLEEEAEVETKFRSCDKKSTLYVLQQNKTLLEQIKKPININECWGSPKHPPFLYERIKNSNLVMIVISNTCGKSLKKLSASPEEIRYNKEFPCYKLDLNNLPHRPLNGCFTEHERVISTQMF